MPGEDGLDSADTLGFDIELLDDVDLDPRPQRWDESRTPQPAAVPPQELDETGTVPPVAPPEPVTEVRTEAAEALRMKGVKGVHLFDDWVGVEIINKTGKKRLLIFQFPEPPKEEERYAKGSMLVSQLALGFGDVLRNLDALEHITVMDKEGLITGIYKRVKSKTACYWQRVDNDDNFDPILQVSE